MGDWTGTVPTILAGDIPTGEDWDTILDILTAVTAPWSTWSPTLSGITEGNGTTTARYRRVGNTIDYHFKFVMGSTSAIGTNPSFTLPATPHSSYVTFRDVMSTSCALVDNGTGSQQGVLLLTGATTVRFHYLAPNYTSVTATAPFTWTAANADELIAAGSYEAA